MKLLFIGSDPSIFIETSPARARMRAYALTLAEQGGELHILSRSKNTSEIKDGTLNLHGMCVSKIASPFALGRAAHALIMKKGIDIVSAQDPFEHGWAAYRAIQGTSAKLHIQVHTDFLSPWFYPSRYLPLLTVKNGTFESCSAHDCSQGTTAHKCYTLCFPAYKTFSH